MLHRARRRAAGTDAAYTFSDRTPQQWSLPLIEEAAYLAEAASRGRAGRFNWSRIQSAASLSGAQRPD
jgi:hypothetical protein